MITPAGAKGTYLPEDGDPILAGGWSPCEEPTPAGVEAGCSPSSNTGYVVPIPAASLD